MHQTMTPHQLMIADIERLLAKAKSGELVALAYCAVGGQMKETGWHADADARDPLAAAAHATRPERNHPETST